MAVAAAVLAGAVVAGAVWIFVMQDVETPAYTVECQDGAFELRQYPPLVVAEVVREGPRHRALQHGFRPLARYIFASNRPGGRIAMTAPVTQTPAPARAGGGSAPPEGGRAWAVRFIMPSGRGLADLPAPSDKAVRLRELPAARRAAVRFRGVADDALLSEKTEALLAWVASRELRQAGPVDFAYYNDPMTPGFLRRNEVIVEVSAAPR
ncbi:MAG: heme-binding protein [Pseudomonadota bacterium]